MIEVYIIKENEAEYAETPITINVPRKYVDKVEQLRGKLGNEYMDMLLRDIFILGFKFYYKN